MAKHLSHGSHSGPPELLSLEPRAKKLLLPRSQLSRLSQAPPFLVTLSTSPFWEGPMDTVAQSLPVAWGWRGEFGSRPEVSSARDWIQARRALSCAALGLRVPSPIPTLLGIIWTL